jgi:hypothetical protein
MSNNKIMSAHAYGRALKELQENKIIAPTGQGNIYYINANLIHNGSRVIVADIIERVEKTEQDKHIININDSYCCLCAQHITTFFLKVHQHICYTHQHTCYTHQHMLCSPTDVMLTYYMCW